MDGEMANTTRAILMQAHTLIQDGLYEQARVLLLPIADNPTAASWLEKIDEIVPPTATRPRKSKTEPEPEDPSLPSALEEAYLIRAARARVKAAEEKRQRFILIAGALSVSVVIVGVVLFLSGFSLSRLLRPMHTHTNRLMTLQHDNDWVEMDTAETRWCLYTDNHCLYHIWHPSGTEFFIQIVPLDYPMSADEFAAFNWNNDLNDPVYYEDFLELLDLTVGSLTAMMQAYGQQEAYVPADVNEWTPDPEREAALWGGRVIDIYVANDSIGYIFTFVNSVEDCVFYEMLPELSEMMSSVRFISDTIVPAKDGYTLATPVTLALNMPWCEDNAD